MIPLHAYCSIIKRLDLPIRINGYLNLGLYKKCWRLFLVYDI